MPIPSQPKIYHIVHVDRLASVISDWHLWCDAEINKRTLPGTTIGMSKIKQRRLNELHLASHPTLLVGDCVPFYFCPRSVMLYILYRNDHSEVVYRGGQAPIIHLEADLHKTVAWANANQRKWAFTLSNAGSTYFEDRCDLAHLDQIDWDAVQAKYWQSQRESKQAEFLLEHHFPWQLVSRIGVYSREIYEQVAAALHSATHRPRVEILPDWYY